MTLVRLDRQRITTWHKVFTVTRSLVEVELLTLMRFGVPEIKRASTVLNKLLLGSLWCVEPTHCKFSCHCWSCMKIFRERRISQWHSGRIFLTLGSTLNFNKVFGTLEEMWMFAFSVKSQIFFPCLLRTVYGEGLLKCIPTCCAVLEICRQSSLRQ